MNKIKRAAVVVLCVLTILAAFTACGGKSPEKLIVGAWRDSTGTTGYEFREDGSVEIIYADVQLPILNTKVTGKGVGTYEVVEQEDGTYNVKLVYTILTKSMTSEYKFTVENNALYLTNISDGSLTVYMAYTPETTAPVDTTAA